MKIRLKLSILLISLFMVKLHAQGLNRKNIIHQLKADKESLFVINGVAFSYPDSLKLDTKLQKIDINSISRLTVLKNEGKISHQTKDVIIILYSTEKRND